MAPSAARPSGLGCAPDVALSSALDAGPVTATPAGDVQPYPAHPTSPTVESTSTSPTAMPSAKPRHMMVTRTRDHTRRDKHCIDDMVRYDATRRVFFATPMSHRDAICDTACRAGNDW
jgi:hypothetical protein